MLALGFVRGVVDVVFVSAASVDVVGFEEGHLKEKSIIIDNFNYQLDLDSSIQLQNLISTLCHSYFFADNSEIHTRNSCPSR